MAQKDKVKELVGRGLGSYHTKSLQQMDRIEKKNKEQNHKISILSNELDNDYLTKTEEGSVISLEHSKEGMVYLDELEGNTLVNYCTDGAKELTLNGDIEIEGTNITLTKGADNGLVDVMCEGNTLVNILNKSLKFGLDSTLYLTCNENGVYNGILSGGNYFAKNANNTAWLELQSNTTYTLKGFLETACNKIGGRIVFFTQDTSNVTKILTEFRVNELNQRIELNLTFTTPSDCKGSFGFYVNPVANFDNVKFSFILGYGDTTSYEVPQYFEGMKSVGECEDNKIEILSSVGKENLINNSDMYMDIANSTYASLDLSFKNKEDFYKVENKAITMSLDIDVENMTPLSSGNNRVGIEVAIECEDGTSKYYGLWNQGDFTGRKSITYTFPSAIKGIAYAGMYIQTNATKCIVGRPKIEISDVATNWCPSLADDLPNLQSFMNKKEITLSEPLRALPNGVCDKIVKIGGKWYVERNTEESIFNGEHSGLTYSGSFSNGEYCCFYFTIRNAIKNYSSNCISDKLSCVENVWEYDTEGMYFQSYIGNVSELLWVKIKQSRLNGTHFNDIKQWLNDNNIKAIYPRTTPIYEPLEIDPTVNTYNDITHISNNSTIPCNMKIQNTGYNAIIKPSTQYTVALDVNKGGTIGLNLGGAKTTTTNNVATITTPATLIDDSLILYGKGIIGSKVRLLEGDKTNWIPSHFEGMKSSFEDKLQDDGTYKMEILSNNKNLIDIERMLNKDNYLKGTYSSIRIPLKPNTTYYFKCNFKPNNIHRWIGVFSEPLGYNGTLKKALIWNDSSEGIKEGSFITDKSTDYYLSIYQPNVSYVDDTWYEELFTSVYNNFIISEVDKNYIEGKSNKIQFSSIEPLRSVGNVKDKFVFKDDKLMIERNVKELFLNNNYILNEQKNYEYTNTKLFEIFPNENNYVRTNGRSRLRCSVLPVDLYTKDYELFSSWDSSNKGFMVRLNKNIIKNVDDVKEWIDNRDFRVICRLAEPTYEEIPFELQKLILEGYENGTLFFDTNIPPTSTVRYAGETPIVKSVKLNKTEVLNNTNDINDNIVPYLMDMDFRVVCLQLEGGIENVSMARLFGGTFEMLRRDIQSKRYSKEEYKYRLDAYLSANKITQDEYTKLGDMLND